MRMKDKLFQQPMLCIRIYATIDLLWLEPYFLYKSTGQRLVWSPNRNRNHREGRIEMDRIDSNVTGSKHPEGRSPESR